MSEHLYHGSSMKIEGTLKPVLRKATEDHVHEQAAVFATERLDIASLFMIPSWALSSIGVEQDIAYICIWGTREAFAPMDPGGYVHVLSRDGFKKVGKDYEWQSTAHVAPMATKRFASIIDGMMECGAQVYFIDHDPIFDRIVADKHHRTPVLIEETSENMKHNKNVRRFSA